MNNEQLQAAKDQAARELYGCEYAKAIADGKLSSDNRGINYFIDRAMEIYAEMVVKNEPCNHPFDKVVQNNGDCVCFKCGHKIK